MTDAERLAKIHSLTMSRHQCVDLMTILDQIHALTKGSRGYEANAVEIDRRSAQVPQALPAVANHSENLEREAGFEPAAFNLEG